MNKIKVYFKQALTLMKQHRLFTGIYVLGTGLSIALTMTLFIIFYVKLGPIYPEYNRARTLVVKSIKRSPKGNPGSWSVNGGVSYNMIRDMLPKLEHAEKVCGVFSEMVGMDRHFLTHPNGKQLNPNISYVDAGFWKLFDFKFISGSPFTTEEVEGYVKVAVISETIAKELFASTNVVGKNINFDGADYKISGVVKDVSRAMSATTADVWLPIYFSSWVQEELKEGNQSMSGNTVGYVLAKKGNVEALKREVEELVKLHNQQNDVFEHDLLGGPYVYWKSELRETHVRPLDLWESLKIYLYMLLALLFIPALNLSGMISSRMDGRLSELGVRKAYGATNGKLLGQVLFENLLLTCVGGVLGLLMAYLIVYTSSDWIIYLFDRYVVNTSGVDIQPEMLFNSTLFLISFLLCVLLNVVSALIPATMALRHNIIESIHSKR